MASRGARKAAQNKKTKAAHAAKTTAYYDDLGSGDKVTTGDILYSAAGAIPFVGGALAVKDLAKGVASVGTTGAIGDAIEGVGKAGAAIGKGAQVAGSLAGIVGAGAAAYDVAKLYNKKKYQEMTPEEQHAFRNRKSGRAASRAKDLARREEMIAKDQVAQNLKNELEPEGESPLTRVNPYAGNYSALSDAVGKGVGDALSEQHAAEARRQAEEDRQRKIESDNLQIEINQNELLQRKIQQKASLFTTADTGYNSVDMAITNISRSIADESGANVAALERGYKEGPDGERIPYDLDTFTTDQAEIQSRVPALEKFKTTMQDYAGQYEAMVGNVSGAMDPAHRAFYQALNGEQGNVIFVNKPGVGTFLNTYNAEDLDPEGNPVEGSEPISSLDIKNTKNIPKPIAKQPSPWQQLKPITAELQKSNPEFGDDARAAVEGALDNLLNTGGEDALKSLAIDHMGFTPEKAEQFWLDSQEDGESALEAEVAAEWLQIAEDQFQDNKLTKYQSEQIRLKEEAAIRAQQQGESVISANKQQQLIQQAYQRQENQVAVTNAVKSGNYQSVFGRNFPGSSRSISFAGKGTDVPGFNTLDRDTRRALQQGLYVIIDSTGNSQKFANKEALDGFLNQTLVGPEIQGINPGPNAQPTPGGQQGGQPGNIQDIVANARKNANNPVQKRSPFRKVMDWVKSPFQKKSPLKALPIDGPKSWKAAKDAGADVGDSWGAYVKEHGRYKDSKDFGVSDPLHYAENPEAFSPRDLAGKDTIRKRHISPGFEQARRYGPLTEDSPVEDYIARSEEFYGSGNKLHRLAAQYGPESIANWGKEAIRDSFNPRRERTLRDLRNNEIADEYNLAVLDAGNKHPEYNDAAKFRYKQLKTPDGRERSFKEYRGKGIVSHKPAFAGGGNVYGEFVDPTLQGQKDWFENWYSDPKTLQRARRFGVEPKDISTQKNQGLGAKVYTGGTDTGSHGQYDNLAHDINVHNSRTGKKSLGHEYTHSSGLDAQFGPVVKGIIGNAKSFGTNDEHAEYFSDPHEQYSWLNSVRQALKVKPGQSITPGMLKGLQKNRDLNNFIKRFSKKDLAKALNTVAEAGPQQGGSLEDLYNQSQVS